MMKSLHAILTLMIFFLALGARAEADIMNGSMELDYNNYRGRTRDTAGKILTNAETNEFIQLYNLNLNLTPLPTIYISGGLLVYKDSSRSTTNGIGATSWEDTLQPTFKAAYRDPYNVFFAEAGYSMRDTAEKGSNTQTQDFFNEEYHLNLGWTPPQSPALPLPSLNMQIMRNNFYDKNPTSQDVTTDTVNFGLHYMPIAGLDIGYNFLATDLTDKITAQENRSDLQSMRATYAQSFWKGRVSASTSFSASLASYEMSQRQAGEVATLQLFPFSGLSAVTDTPPLDTLAANGLLIDGNLTASANMDIGAALSLAGDTRYRETAFDFGIPTEVSSLLLWVNQQLSDTIAGSFNWTVYVSTDNVTWTQVPGAVHTQFGPFQNRFSLDFQTVKTRYLKVSTRPLSLAVQGATNPNYQHIYITEMQGFHMTTSLASAGNSDTEQASYVYGLNVTTQIVPGVSHVFSYSFMEGQVSAKGLDSTSRQYTLSNGLNVTRRFAVGPNMTATGQFSRQDSMNSEGRRQGAYSYGAALNAVPLPTLRGSVIYGGSINDDGSNSDTLTLDTVAELYTGVSLHSMAGVQAGMSATGTRSRGYNFLTAAGVAPRRDLTLSFTYRGNRTSTFGQAGVTAASLAQYDLSATYRPFETLFLTSTLSFIERSQSKNMRSSNYGLNWSPFLTGVLQFGFFYNEAVQTDIDAKTKTYGPNLTLTIFPRSALELSYYNTQSEYTQGASEARSFNAQFRMGF